MKKIFNSGPPTDKEANRALFKETRVNIDDTFNIFGKLYILNKGEISIGTGFLANSGIDNNPIGGDTVLRVITYTPEAKINIGNNVGISNSTILAWNKITIDDNVMIGGGVRVWDTNFHSLDPIIRTSYQHHYAYDVKTSPVHIKEYAFIGAGSIICKGVTIGRNSIIAAGSVVVKSIPDNVIAGGNPCTVIKSL
ncbi:acyltransferase [Mucilaginibacter daejeonensis]|uniref:acyltransferase n=1 Tax=Mucilaginibacter daejeonensis TaxID=398049 RepID=UPI001D171329|nr:acyltransferase [Mucilaginibacter daejeonensis]UEG52976.1 acyltransferase [Mucilaginibacter daejeonensis]